MYFACIRARSLQSCLTPCDSMDSITPGFSVHGDSPGKNNGVGCHALLQGIFSTQGLNLHLMFPSLPSGFFTTSATWEAPELLHICSTVVTAFSIGWQRLRAQGCGWPERKKCLDFNGFSITLKLRTLTLKLSLENLMPDNKE